MEYYLFSEDILVFLSGNRLLVQIIHNSNRRFVSFTGPDVLRLLQQRKTDRSPILMSLEETLQVQLIAFASRQDKIRRKVRLEEARTDDEYKTISYKLFIAARFGSPGGGDRARGRNGHRYSYTALALKPTSAVKYSFSSLGLACL